MLLADNGLGSESNHSPPRREAVPPSAGAVGESERILLSASPFGGEEARERERPTDGAFGVRGAARRAPAGRPLPRGGGDRARRLRGRLPRHRRALGTHGGGEGHHPLRGG